MTPEDEDDDFLAAEMALGLAEGRALETGRARMANDPVFAAQVAFWQERLVAMTDGIAPEEPPARVKKQLLASLFPHKRVPVMQRLWVWQGLTLASLVLVGVLGVQLLEVRTRPLAGPPPVFAAQLAGDSAVQVLAVVDPVAHTITMRRTAGETAPGRSHQLWAIVPDAPPISLGLLTADGTAFIIVPEQLEGRAAEVTLAVSDEPEGGSPTGAPTGEVLAAGPLTRL